jgi:hypothetical protein
MKASGLPGYEFPVAAQGWPIVQKWTRTGTQVYGSILCAVIDPQYLDSCVFDAVNRDVGQRQEQNFPGSFAAGTATVRRVSQGTDRLVNLPHRGLPVVRIVVFEVLADVL